MAEDKNLRPSQIVFFDGVCHLCNGFVDFVIQNETPHSELIFAPLQGETARKFLSEKDRESLSSVLFYDAEKVYRESEAVLRILKRMRGPWRLLGSCGLMLPKVILDPLYRTVASRRYQWFGQRDSCRLPLPEEKKKLWP